MERNCTLCVHRGTASSQEPCKTCLEDMDGPGMFKQPSKPTAQTDGSTDPSEGATTPPTPPAPSEGVVPHTDMGSGPSTNAVVVMLLPDRDTYTRQDVIDILTRLGIAVL